MRAFQSLLIGLFIATAQSSTAQDFPILQSIDVGRAPHGFRVEGKNLYIANAGDDTIGVVDLDKGKQIRTIPAPNVPLDLIRYKQGWLVTAFRGTVLNYIDQNGIILKTFDVGESPSLFTVGHSAQKISVVSEFANQISLFDSAKNQITKTLPTGQRPYPSHVTKDGILLFTPNRMDGTVNVYDLLNDELVKVVEVCRNPEGGTLTKDEVSYIVACGGDDKILFMNTASFEVTHEVAKGIGPRPFSVIAGPDGRYAYVNNAGGESVSVIDLKTKDVTQAIPTGKQPIVMRIFGRKLYIANEISNTLNIIQLPPKPSGRGSKKNEVIVMGMIHSGHETSKRYSLERVKSALRQIKPDYILTEIPPNRLDKALMDWEEYGEIKKPRVKRFAEYTRALFPLLKDLNATIIPTAGWNDYMNKFRRHALNTISKDPSRATHWAAYEAAIKKMETEIGARSDDPHFIHTSDYDRLTKEGLTPYDELFNDELGTGGWTTINEAHYSLIDQALNRHSGGGKRVLITFGAGHKYWFLEQLKKRDDIELINASRFFKD